MVLTTASAHFWLNDAKTSAATDKRKLHSSMLCRAAISDNILITASLHWTVDKNRAGFECAWAMALHCARKAVATATILAHRTTSKAVGTARAISSNNCRIWQSPDCAQQQREGSIPCQRNQCRSLRRSFAFLGERLGGIQYQVVVQSCGHWPTGARVCSRVASKSEQHG